MRGPRKKNSTAQSASPAGRGVVAVVPAAGLGRRFGRGGRKVFFSLLGKPVLVWTLEPFQRVPQIGEIIVVVRKADLCATTALLQEHRITKAGAVVAGGRERQDSVWRGLQHVGDGDAVVIVHDGARPFVSDDVIARCLGALRGCDGVVAGMPVRDTVKEVAADNDRGRAGLAVRRTLERSRLWAVQTPQVFLCRTLREAHERARREGFYATDDAALVERYGGLVKIVPGSDRNIKITTRDDVAVAEALCAAYGPCGGS